MPMSRRLFSSVIVFLAAAAWASSASAATVSVPATGTLPNYFTDSGVNIPAGAYVAVTAAGTWSVCPPGISLSCTTGPDGVGGFAPAPNTTDPLVSSGTLIASLDGANTWSAIGAGPTVVRGPGELLLATNDVPPSKGNCGSASPQGCYADNEGSVTATITPVTALARGAFVIGNNNATVGGSVTFYEAEELSQWSGLNSLSGGPAPASFVGFAETSASPPTCGEKWTSKPGTSSAPPATVPEYMEVVAASKITKSRSTISGNAVELVVVKTSPGYSPETKGPGKVVAVVQCT